MATKKPESRKTHVTRIFGTNKNKDILHDMWVDVERIDKATMKKNAKDLRGQKTVRKLKWTDDPRKPDDYVDPDDEDALYAAGQINRKTVLVKLCDPESTDDFSDPDEWIPVRKLKKIKSKRKVQHDGVSQTQVEKWVNDDTQHSRVVEARRFLHYDTNIDDEADKAAEDDPTIKAYVVKSDDYTRLDGQDGTEDTKDDSQWIEHEVVTKVIHKGNKVYYGNAAAPNDLDTSRGQVLKTKFHNNYLIDDSEPAKLEKLGQNDVDPPYRLDPYQNIININWGGLAVEFGNGADGPPEKS